MHILYVSFLMLWRRYQKVFVVHFLRELYVYTIFTVAYELKFLIPIYYRLKKLLNWIYKTTLCAVMLNRSVWLTFKVYRNCNVIIEW